MESLAAGLLARARKLRREGALDEAAKLYRETLERQPQDVDVLREFATIRRTQGRLEESLHLFESALKISPKDFEALLAKGNVLFAMKRHVEAVTAFDEALRIRPDSAEAHNNRGGALGVLSRHAEALMSFDKAIELRPDYADAHRNRGMALAALNRYHEAIASYEQALAIKPDDPAMFYKRGIALQALNRHDEALASYEQALTLNSRFVEALNNRGNALAALDRHEDALASFEKALALNPTLAEALNNRGSALQALGRLDEALASYEKALVIKPKFDEALNNRGNVLTDLGRHAEARASYERSLGNDPDSPDGFNRHGNALAGLARFEDAIASYERALAIKPEFAQALYNRGNALTALNRHDEAIASYEQALAIRPNYAEALNNLGATLQSLNRHEEAIATYKQFLAIKPDDAGVHFNASLARLTLGDLQAGWEEYEWRWRSKDFTSHKRDFTQPLWLGKAPLAGKTILLHGEQGFGDILQFVRYVPSVAQQGARVLLEVPGALRRLFEGIKGAEQVIAKGESLPSFDFHCPLMSLPLAFGTTLQSIPCEVPYLSAPARRIEHWRQQLGTATRPRVGIVWSGRLTHKNDHNRSIPLSALLALAGDGVELVSLQKEVRSDDQATLAQFGVVRHFGEELRDFADTAALISLMDIVVSVDTAPAHLAGALGKPVWILLPFRPDWRWLLDREDSPWYPTARLFRQPAIGDWESVIERVRAELRSNLGDTLHHDAPASAELLRSLRVSGPSENKSPWSTSRTLNRAAVLLRQGNLAEAEHLFRSILAVHPSHFESLHLLGLCKGQQGKHDEAYALISNALKNNPQSAAALRNRGVALQALNRNEEAIASYQQALGIRPDDVDALSYLGNALAKLNRHEEAIATYDKLLGVRPGSSELLYNRGNSLQALGRYEEAAACYEKSLALRPNCVEALNNRGNALQAVNRHQEAIASYQQALAIEPENAETHFNESLVRLALGDLVAGWQKYEWRWKKKEFTSPKRDFTQPLWLGKEPIAGKTILLHAEQGFGDAIQFVRYAPMVARQRARVLLEVQGPLRRLLNGLKGVERVITKGEALPEFDLHCPLLSLPLAFGTTLDTIPSDPPYLKAAPARVLHWRNRLGPRDSARVGLTWSGRATLKNDHNRSVALAGLLPLTSLGLEFVSLQKDVRAADREVLKAHPQIRDFAGELKDFADTAALVSLMDLVISVDTAQAHLAGALGKPVWVLLPFVPDWRWLLDREDSPWYPTARLFRQPAIGEWKSVIERVRSELVSKFGGALQEAETASTDLPRSPRDSRPGRKTSPWSTSRMLNRAAVMLQQGNLTKAEQLFRSILAVNPGHFESLHLLGLCKGQQGKHDEAYALINEALKINPGSAEALKNRGIVLVALNRHEEAIVSYQQALAINPDDIDALSNLGNALAKLNRHEQAIASYDKLLGIKPDSFAILYNRGNSLQVLNRYEEAIASYQKALAIRPNSAEALNNCGNALQAVNRYHEAIASYDQVLAIRPDSSELLYNRGNSLLVLNRHEEAIASYQKALAMRPDYAEALRNQGNAFAALNRYEEAIGSYDKLLRIQPNSAEVLYNRGNSLKALNRHDEAIASYEQALAVKPDYAEALNNRGNSLQVLNRHEEAIASYEQALAVKPDYPEALNNRGNSLQALNRHQEAISSYQQAISITPDYALAHTNEGLARLALGDMSAGWEKYEWRWGMKEFTSLKRDFKRPVWLGKEPLAGKTILLHAEQGLGDTLQCVRYARLLEKLGARIIVQVQSPLVTLLQDLLGADRVIGPRNPLPLFDLHCPLLSLPLAFGTALDTIPSDVPYLKVAPQRISHWSKRLGPSKAPSVGLCWSGRVEHKNDHNRSIALARLLSLSSLDLEFVSLQKDVRDADREVLKANPRIRDFGSELKDFADTAALMSLLDLVISVDTAPVHLAGALGKPVWVLLPFAPDWRWLLDREDSPWYPTARLFRQPAFGDWDSVIRRVVEELQEQFALGENDGKRVVNAENRS